MVIDCCRELSEILLPRDNVESLFAEYLAWQNAKRGECTESISTCATQARNSSLQTQRKQRVREDERVDASDFAIGEAKHSNLQSNTPNPFAMPDSNSSTDLETDSDSLPATADNETEVSQTTM